MFSNGSQATGDSRRDETNNVLTDARQIGRNLPRSEPAMTLRLKITLAFLGAGMFQAALIMLIASAMPIDTAFLLTTILTTYLVAVGLGHAVGRPLAEALRGLADTVERFSRWEMAGPVPCRNRNDEIGEIARALESYRESALTWTEGQEAEKDGELVQQRLARAATEDSIAGFRSSMGSILASFAENAKQLDETAQALSSLADDTNRRMTLVATASGKASANVATVASTAEELSVSVHEIGTRVSSASRIVGHVTDSARSANGRVDGLEQATQRIGAVVGLIQEVAEQTNLLALNATIEAARAGVAGRGFAVVASEVKALAEQTAKATDDIRQQISAIQGSTKGAVEAMQGIVATMAQVDGYTQDIAAAVEQQTAATSEISASIRHAARGAHDVASHMPSLTRAVDETSQSAGQMRAVSHDLSARAEEMRRIVETFLADVTSRELRMATARSA